MLAFDPEKELVATLDFYGKMLSAVEAAYTYKFDGGAGNICTIAGPKSQILKVSEGSRGGLAIFNVDAKLNGSAGNDALAIAFT